MKVSVQTKVIHHFAETGLDKMVVVSIAVTNDIIVQEMTDIQSDCEDVCIKIDLFGIKSLLIGAYYKPHEHDQHSKLNCNIWVAGDFKLPKMDCDHMCPSPDCKHPSFYRQITEVLNDSNLSLYQLVIPIFLISSLQQIRLL